MYKKNFNINSKEFIYDIYNHFTKLKSGCLLNLNNENPKILYYSYIDAINNSLEYISEYYRILNDVIKLYYSLTSNKERLYILYAFIELSNFLNKKEDNIDELTILINKYPFICLKIIDYENYEYYDLYDYLYSQGNFKKCITLLINKGLSTNVEYHKKCKNVLSMDCLGHIICEDLYYLKMKLLILDIENPKVTSFLNLLSTNYNKKIILNDYNINDIDFLKKFEIDYNKLLNIIIYDEKIIYDTYYQKLILSKKIIDKEFIMKTVKKHLVSLRNILTNYYNNNPMNNVSYENHIKKGIAKIVQLLFNKNTNINQLYDLKQDYPELFKDYIVKNPIGLKNYALEYWSITCFINKKFCSDYWKNILINNFVNYNLPTNINFDYELIDYYNTKLNKINTINNILDNDNSNEKISIEYTNLIISFRTYIDPFKLNNLINCIKSCNQYNN